MSLIFYQILFTIFAQVQNISILYCRHHFLTYFKIYFLCCRFLTLKLQGFVSPGSSKNKNIPAIKKALHNNNTVLPFSSSLISFPPCCSLSVHHFLISFNFYNRIESTPANYFFVYCCRGCFVEMSDNNRVVCNQ